MRFSSIVVGSLLTSSIMMAGSINVTPQWQLLGAVEGIPVNTFDGKCVDFVWTFENNMWKVHVANGGQYNIPSNIGNLDFIDRGAGFWIKGHDYCNISVENNNDNNNSANNGYEKIELGMEMPQGQNYDSLQASSSPLDLTKTYYDVEVDHHDGLEVEGHRFDTSTGKVINKKFKNGSWVYDDNDTFTASSGTEFTISGSGDVNNQFKIKFLGTVSGTEANTLLNKEIFNTSDVGYKFAYKAITDQYWFDDGEYQYKNYNNHTQYSSLKEFMNDTKGRNWWQCSDEDNCSSGGIAFSADSNFDSGNGDLVVVSSDGTVVNNDAGTWEVKTVNGKTAIVTYPSRYEDDDYPAFIYNGTGVKRGGYEPAGSEVIFFLLDENAKNSFVNYVKKHHPSTN
jgi:hypothetical protein